MKKAGALYKNNFLSLEELLKLDKSFKMHHRNTQSFSTELFKVKNNLSIRIMSDFLTNTIQKMKFSIDFFSKCDQIRRKTADLLTFTEEICNGNLIFCAVQDLLAIT